ncbi:MAG: hypothetical protein K0R12_425 [Gammaproteobacteria bacterium]|nr:hypothetical protein [Gammaproteobacteria bacterium]
MQHNHNVEQREFAAKMKKLYSINTREINFLITAAMIFFIGEVLSIEFNQYFNNLYFFGIVCPFNVSVTFFCFSFFIMDLVA